MARSANLARSRATGCCRPRGITTPRRRWSAATPALAAHFDGGHFATLYLSPKDYHRIHMPCPARLTRMVHVPGDLFSVNPVTARAVPGLFARNERVVCVFDTAFRSVRAGAGWGHDRRQYGDRVARRRQSAATGQAAGVATTRVRRSASRGRGDGPLPARVDRGDAVSGGPLRFNPDWKPNLDVRMGQPMGSFGET